MYRNEQQIPKGAIIGCESQRENDIPAALHELEKSISVLRDEISILYGRLNPVMRNEPTGDERYAEAINRCELSGIIRSNAVQISNISKDVKSVIGLLEI